jgi:hypothetical protein
MLGRLVAILTFSRRTESLTGPAKVIDGDTIVVAGQMVSGATASQATASEADVVEEIRGWDEFSTFSEAI